ncbi:hypothetical protein LCGC14_3120210 [marine sediment metagenome]|uniref:ASCH domain-containing protein n=1 Tax=marine sediment metagenome TaxID=412755 RepID=A0A0F8W2V8_9ZZZZ
MGTTQQAYQRIQVPFLEEFRERMLDGRKTATTRTKRFGKVGDVFDAFGELFWISDVQAVKLFDVADLEFSAEGFEDPDAFLEVWDRLHPRVKHNLDRVVYLHRFEVLE